MVLHLLIASCGMACLPRYVCCTPSFLGKLQMIHRYNGMLRRPHSDMTGSGSTVSHVLEEWKVKFMRVGIPEPEQSADLIVAHSLGKKMIHQVHHDRILHDREVARISDLCHKRLLRWPVQYVIGEWDFHDMTLDMRAPVLIPRTETEELAAYLVEDERRRGTPAVVLDVGCGSGALALHLLRQLAQHRCVAVDVSKAACQLTQHNACKYGLQDRLTIVHGDISHESILEEIAAQGPYDVIVSNPPYISTADMDNLDKQVSGFEDHKALHGGIDGLDVVRHILATAGTLLKPHTGMLWLEVDLSHPKLVEELVTSKHGETLQYVHTLQDYTARDRFCVIRARRNSPTGSEE